MKAFYALSVLSMALAQVAMATKPLPSVTLNVDTSASHVGWTGKKVVGASHNGLVQLEKGSFVTKNGKPVSGELVVDLNTMTNEDLKDEGYNAKLLGHLKSEDFFDVAKHKNVTLKLTKISLLNNAAPGAPNLSYVGDLTIKGVTKKVSGLAQYEAMEHGFTTTGELKVDRTDFGLKYGSGKFFKDLGDKVIADEIALSFKVVAKK
jgi:polyisoprenoid-binding protein YceI